MEVKINIFVYNLKFKFNYSDLKKLNKVARSVQNFVGRGDFEEFVRFMYSVSRFEDEIEFNFVHPQVLLPIIMPTFRNEL